MAIYFGAEIKQLIFMNVVKGVLEATIEKGSKENVFCC